MTTAFQPSAFQNNAFQIDSQIDTHDGGGAIRSRRIRKNPPGNIMFIYEHAKELPRNEVKKLISAIDPYIEINTVEEERKRQNAEYVIDVLPDLDRFDFAAVAANALAYQRFLEAIKEIEGRLAIYQQAIEDDELLLLTLLSCTII